MEQSDTRTLMLLEGNIAAGKSQLLNTLVNTGALVILPEPVELWRSAYPDNFLDLYYTDPNRWAFALQILAFTTRAKTWGEILAWAEHERYLMERSVFSDRHVFAKLLYSLGNMTESEYQLYCDMWDFMAGQWAVKPDRIFYLRTPAEVCLERIAERGRQEEAGIELEFLLRLEVLHDEWLLDRDDTVVLDGLKPTDELVEDVIRAIGVG